MSISSETRATTPKLGNGTWTDIAFNFKVFETGDVVLVQTDTDGIETTLTETTDYTVTLNTNQNTSPGGTITLTSVSTTGYYYTATSDVSNTQPTTITNLGGFFPAVLNNALDRLTILVQQLVNKVDRSFKIPISDGDTAPDMPTATLRANKVLAFDTDGNPIAAAFGDISTSIDVVLTSEATNDFLVWTASNQFENKTLAEVQTILNIPSDISDLAALKSAYGLGDVVESDVADFATAAQGATADSASAALASKADVTYVDGQMLGVGQSWTDVSASRAIDTEYTNSTGRPIQLAVTVRVLTSSETALKVGGTIIANAESGTNTSYSTTFSVVVPDGETYEVEDISGTVTVEHWWELR